MLRRNGGVLLVHRPKYDDWTFPKGKLEEGESFEAAVAREVEEETGWRGDLGMPVMHLPQIVGLALGLEPKELGMNKHVVSTREVQKKVAALAAA